MLLWIGKMIYGSSPPTTRPEEGNATAAVADARIEFVVDVCGLMSELQGYRT
jgi:hypothetical protein